jgi:Domain of unknown function (DUF4870)
MPHYRPAPEWPPVPGCPPGPAWPVPGQPATGAWLTGPMPDWPPAPDYPAVPPYFPGRDRPPVPDWPAAAGSAAAGSQAGRRAAVLGYLTVPAFGVPLLVYLSVPRRARWARGHAAQAVNVWFTGFLYDLSAVIMGAMLALGSPGAALMIFAPLAAARWLVTLACLARAARAAARGAGYTFPGWLCMRAVR